MKLLSMVILLLSLQACETPVENNDKVESVKSLATSEYKFKHNDIKNILSEYEEKNFNAFSERVNGMLANMNYRTNYDLYRLYKHMFLYDEKKESRDLAILNAWCQRKSESHIPFLVRGVYYIDIAWNRRGGAIAFRTTREAFDGLEKYALLAKRDLEHAYELNPNDPNSSATLIWVAIALGLKSEVETYFDNAQKAFKGDFSSFLNKLNFYKPKWYGARKSIFSSKPTVKKIVSEADSLISYNPILEQIKLFMYIDNYWADTSFDFSQSVLEDIKRRSYNVIKSHPSNRYLVSSFAYIMSKVKEYDLAVELYDKASALGGKRELSKYNYYLVWAEYMAYYKVGENLHWIQKKKMLSYKYFLKALAVKKTHAAYYGLGRSYWSIGYAKRDISYYIKSEDALSKALEIKPEDKATKKDLALIREQISQIKARY